MTEPLHCYIGFDSREPIAFAVLAHSILTRASGLVTITPLVQDGLRSAGWYTRDRGPTESTEFSLTRFLCPALSGYKGVSVFLDCDILCRCDLVGEVWRQMVRARARAQWDHGPMPAVLVAKHDYTPRETTKFLGNPQTIYPKKNWSSVMVFDNTLCRSLTPEYVNHATGLQLHRFEWLDDAQVGGLPLDMNHLVGEYEPNPHARLFHYTVGGPWHPGFEDCDHADEWRAERDAMHGIPAPVPA